MFLTPEQFAAANKASVDAMLSLANTALANAERIAALNFNSTRTLLEDSLSNAGALLAARTPQQAMALAAAQLRPAVEQALSYGRSLCEISAQTKEEASRQLESQFDEFQKQVASLMDQATRNAPPGSDVAIASVRAALEAARSAFDYMKTVHKQAAEIDEVNIATASQATVDALRSASPAKKKRSPRAG